MGVRTLRAVLERSRARASERMVLVVLAEHASDRTATCFPSVDTIAKECGGITSRSVQLALNALVRAGELEVVEHGAPLPAVRHQYRPNLYRLPLVANPTSPLTNGQTSSSGELHFTSNPPLVANSTSPLNGPSGEIQRVPVVNPTSPKPKEEPLPGYAADAHTLARLAFEQPVKPVLRSKGNAFCAVQAIFHRLLEAGEDAKWLDAAIRHGVDTWTIAGVQTAIAKAKQSPRLGEHTPQIVNMT